MMLTSPLGTAKPDPTFYSHHGPNIHCHIHH